MKKIVAVVLAVILQISIVLGYSVTIKIKGVDLEITGETGNEMELTPKDTAIKGWKVKRGGVTINNNKFIMPAADVEIEAIVQYNVTLNNQNATTAGSTSVVVTWGEAMPAITKPAKTYTITYNHNYTGSTNSVQTQAATFGGYYTGTSGSGTQYYTSAGSSARTCDIRKDTTLYANWTASKTYVPTRTGYIFGGWYKEAACTNQITTNNGAYTIPSGTASAITLYAKWTPITYTVKYNGNGNTGGSTADSSHTYDVAKNLTANGFTKSYAITYNHNYTGSTNGSATAKWNFDGWAESASGAKKYNDKQSVTNLSSTQGATVNLYAKWSGGNVTLPTPTRTGYTFGGWYKESSCTNKAGDGGASYNITATTTLYAKWTANTYTVKYNGNGNTGGSTADSTHTYDVAKNLTANGFTKAYTVTYNHNYTGSSNTTATGTYTFSGWAESASGAVKYSNQQSVTNLSSTNGATVNLYAKWTGGSITLATPTRTGYAFMGWYKEASCTTLVGEGGDSYTPASNITLYAKWVSQVYTITTIEVVGADIQGEYTNYVCSVCGGANHECETANIMIEEANSVVVEAKDTEKVIVVMKTEGVVVEGDYTNYKCSQCGVTDHTCEVVTVIQK